VEVKPDWSFARKPFWLFSHVFVGAAVVSFLIFASWQWDRHQTKQEQNAEIIGRSTGAPITVSAALGEFDATDRADLEQLEFVPVTATGVYLDGDFVDIANRSQAGAAGGWRMGLFQPSDGSRAIIVNRGFIPLNDSITPESAPVGEVTLEGWLRLTQERGAFGPTDTGEGRVAPRVDIAKIGERTDEELAPMWFQLSPNFEENLRPIPDPVDLPEPDPGPHLGYVGQWIIFAVLTIGFYVVVLNRRAKNVRPPERSDSEFRPVG